MTLEQQVASLELAKRLKELGVKTESAFCWYVFKDHEPELFRGTGYGKTDKSEMYSAFTGAELGEMLPGYVKTWRWHDLDKEGREYWNCESDKYYAQEFAVTEADARAKMLIHLLENKLIQLP